MDMYDDFDKYNYIILPRAVKFVLIDQTKKALRKRKLTSVQKDTQAQLKVYWHDKSPFTLTGRGLVVDKEYLYRLNNFLCLYGKDQL